MTVTPRLEGDPYGKSPAGRNADLPEGLKSPPVLPEPGREVKNPDYPALGFNPVPGDRDTVRALHKKLVSCAEVLDDTHAVVTKLMDGSYWEGDAAVAYREQLQDGPLPKNLQNAANSIGRAARQLSRWEGELEGLQSRAKRLNEDAKDAREALRKAKGAAETAGDDPDLDGKQGAGHDSAKKALTRANARVEDAEAELERILGRARKLAYEHEEKAGRRATKIRDATDELAPHEPGWFESALDWVKENLPDILSTVAAVVGLVALFVVSGGTAAAVLLLAAAALSAGALALRVTQDPDVWASLKDGFTKGELDQDFWSNLVTVGGDALGAVPGLGAVARGGAAAVRGMGEAVTVGQKFARFGGEIMDGAKSVSSLENALLASTIRGARAEPVIKTVQVTSTSLGAATAATGLGMKMADADDDGIKGGAVAGIDGARLGVDGGGIVDIARHVFGR
ncbi:putative T7SS-secreted protein [Streptomyces sp. NPDC052114]|uniref:putative T7SS-secreted protein n=1 Tax=unclassified Streptomyces TaxID=2593676 RepID=UPI003448F89F